MFYAFIKKKESNIDIVNDEPKILNNLALNNS